MSNEAKDRAYRNLLDRSAELYRDFHEALDILRTIADDFSEGSQQRWMLQVREANAIRDQLWSVQQEIVGMDDPDQPGLL